MKSSADRAYARFAKSKSKSRTNISRSGVSLVEMLVAMTVSLIMIYALLHAFAYVINFVTAGRAMVEASGQVRGASYHLTNDLRHLTAPVRAWHDRESMTGYFEYIEGLGYDYDPVMGFVAAQMLPPGTQVSNTSVGDFDDVLAMTVSSKGQPFVGQVIFVGPNNTLVPTTIDSPYAESVWWCVWNDADSDLQPGVNEVTLYRRVLLVRPDIAPFDGTTLGLIASFARPDNSAGYQQLWDDLEDFYDNNDISVRPEVVRSNMQVVVRMWANSLADLTRRENRFCHRGIVLDNGGNFTVADDTTLPAQYPYEMKRLQSNLMPSLITVVQGINNRTGLTNDQLGEDVMQSHVVAFDVKAYDPFAPLIPSSSLLEVLSPHDPGYGTPPHPPQAVGVGAFVDLFYMRYVLPRIGAVNPPVSPAPPPWAAQPSPFTVYPYSVQNPTAKVSVFSGPAAFYDNNNNGWLDGEPYRGVTTPTYDTWSFHYEQDAIDQDNDGLVDEGTDGFDNDDANGVDDPNERETAPPYAAPLRGIRVSLRVNEPDSRQVKQTTVEQDFTPE